MLQQILTELAPSQTKLVAVSKQRPISQLSEMYEQGQRVFGENRAQELKERYEELPKDIEWHMIGQLQSKKVKYIASFIHLIHSVDSLSLLTEINKRAASKDRVIKVLLQFFIATESTKAGLSLEEAKELLESEAYQTFQNIEVCGVMGMATYTSDLERVRAEFKHLKQIFDSLKAQYFQDKPAFKEISMGMSGDYKIAIEEGSTMVRIGSLLFNAAS